MATAPISVGLALQGGLADILALASRATGLDEDYLAIATDEPHHLWSSDEVRSLLETEGVRDVIPYDALPFVSVRFNDTWNDQIRALPDSAFGVGLLDTKEAVPIIVGKSSPLGRSLNKADHATIVFGDLQNEIRQRLQYRRSGTDVALQEARLRGTISAEFDLSEYDKPRILDARVSGFHSGLATFIPESWARIIRKEEFERSETARIAGTPRPDRHGRWQLLRTKDGQTANTLSESFAAKEFHVISYWETLRRATRNLDALRRVLLGLALVTLFASTILASGSMVLMIRDTRRELGIMRALGLRMSAAIRFVVLMALAVSGLGASAGVLLGLLLSKVLSFWVLSTADVTFLEESLRNGGLLALNMHLDPTALLPDSLASGSSSHFLLWILATLLSSFFAILRGYRLLELDPVVAMGGQEE